jgi:hypothetical protein
MEILKQLSLSDLMRNCAMLVTELENRTVYITQSQQQKENKLKKK